MNANQTKVVDSWSKRKAAADLDRQNYEPDWRSLLDLYMNRSRLVPFEGAEWARNDLIADGFKHIETSTAQLATAVANNPQFFTCVAPSVAGETYEQSVQSLLRGGWNRSDMIPRSVPPLRMGLVLGHMMTKSYWKTEIGQKSVLKLGYTVDNEGQALTPTYRRAVVDDVTFNGPWTDFPDLSNVWKDPSGKMSWVIERIWVSLAALKEENRQFEGRLYTGLKKLETKVSYRPTAVSSGLASVSPGGVMLGWGGDMDQESLLSQLSGIPDAARVSDGDAVQLQQCWGWVDPDVYEYRETENPETGEVDPPTQWRLHVIANGSELIRDVPCPTPDLRPPYDDVPCIQVGDESYGRSPLLWARPDIEYMSELRNMRLAEVQLGIWGTYIADRDADPEDNNLFKQPHGVWWVHNMGRGNLDGVIAPMKRSPMLQEAYLENGLMDQHVQGVMGSTEPFRGEAMGGRTTATEASMVANVGSARYRLQAILTDANFIRKTLRRHFKLYQSRLTSGEVIELGDPVEGRDMVDFQDLQYDVDILVDSGQFGSLGDQQVAKLVQLATAFAAVPEGAISVRWNQLIKDAFFRAGFARASRYVRSENEIAQIQQQQQQQELLIAAFGEAAKGGAGATQPG